MKFLEKDLEDLIWENCQDEKGRDLLISKGFPSDINDGTMYRQFNLDSYGIMDLMSMSDLEVYSANSDTLELNMSVSIYELKRDHLDLEAIRQLSVYMAGVEHFIADHILDLSPPLKGLKYTLSIETKGYLIGGRFKNDIVFVAQQCPGISLVTYNFDINHGLTFKSHEGQWKKTRFDIERTNHKWIDSDEFSEQVEDYLQWKKMHESKEVAKSQLEDV